jgi:hypothetical protein
MLSIFVVLRECFSNKTLLILSFTFNFYIKNGNSFIRFWLHLMIKTEKFQVPMTAKEKKIVKKNVPQTVYI